MNDAHDVTVGLPPGAFERLTAEERAAMVRLMARIAERSYRRGACHALTIDPDDRPTDLVKWRFGIRLDVSPLLDSRNRTRPSVTLLFDHNPKLQAMGFVR